ncbi:class I SAM-dependent methyltransferase [Allostreptomyces psammosilenae]|uniref:THUMP-like domain-containing protein n=1 Tax=Allostreptomyces psammosilenae TaxID=1892865 RepID=A0A852ZVI9_9ACTN|nr:class I SAM-dependent methyltransferase [Allostreptomyces psammosilenae]NYI05955.1 hypothetical protein [Allostreptomyces psammosilenae]
MDPRTLTTLRTADGERLLEQLRDFQPGQELALATRLRREHPAELVSAALTQARLRQRARAKFGAEADAMFFTPGGVEQSTRADVATHRARRIAERLGGSGRVADLCCGIGADAVALARAGLAVLAVDADPATCAVAEANAAALGLADRVEVVCGDAAGTLAAALADGDAFDAVFLDPARRDGRGRIFDPEGYSPPLSTAVELARLGRAVGAVKVAPGIPHEAVPDDATAEWVSVRGDVKEAVLWFGAPAGGPDPAARAAERFTATLLPGAPPLRGPGTAQAPDGPVLRYLHEPDGAVVRAHLVAEVAEQLGGHLIDPTIAYITADTPGPSPYTSAYEITDVLPFNLKRLRAIVRERAIGTLTVKKRGSAVQPEELRRRVKPAGPNAATVIVTRVAGAPTMLLAQPVGG